MRKVHTFVFVLVLATVVVGQPVLSVRNGTIKLEVDSRLFTRVLPEVSGAHPLMNAFLPSEQLLIDAGALTEFSFVKKYKTGDTLVVVGTYQKGQVTIAKQLRIVANKQYSGVLVIEVVYHNMGAKPVSVRGWKNHAYRLQSTGDDPPFWSYQSGSYEERYDWVTPLRPGFYRRNYMGMNASDYGGGTPVVDVWRRDVGIAIGHVDIFPRLVSLPVDFRDPRGLRIDIEMEKSRVLNPGESLRTLPTFVMVHQGDFFKPLRTYRRMLENRGIRFAGPVPTAYEPIWCAWGYERNFTVDQIVKTIPKVKSLGLEWVVIDDGWQTAEGDWYLNPRKFPHGDADMKKLVETIHKAGLKAKLWWTPLAVDPGTDLYTNHRDMLLLNADGSPRLITWWDSYYLCPAYAPVREYTRRLVQKFIGEWGFDGLKIDGQHLNGVPPCYNPAHHHHRPEESVEQLPDFFRMIYREATKIKPEAVVEICACGTAASVFNMANMNQPVASDPLSSWQIRHRAKVYKALMGPNVAYYGDHVELSDGFQDFASTVGVGGVIGTKFTLPGFGSDTVQLTPEREKLWKKWISIYNAHRLAEGQYRGDLYDIGYDRPETHVIQKGDTLFYAFYAPEYQGTVTFRGLEAGKSYRIWDYVHDKNLGIVSRSTPVLPVQFTHALLVAAVPVEKK